MKATLFVVLSLCGLILISTPSQVEARHHCNNRVQVNVCPVPVRQVYCQPGYTVERRVVYARYPYQPVVVYNQPYVEEVVVVPQPVVRERVFVRPSFNFSWSFWN